MKKKIELLAPAGSVSVLKACVSAGADAVYMGLPRFSARAYAENAGEEDFREAVHFAHLHGVKLYLAVNTLFKEDELFHELHAAIQPLYEAGLDAVIVQDIGAMAFLHAHFPLLPIHVSTQAVVTGAGAAAFFQSLGATRVVPARECSLTDIKRIISETGLEVESFVHGALCYSYSGACLFSSFVGGRSGNRGRCAQPCRMPYLAEELSKRLNDENSAYVLSMKDLNTLSLLPKLMDAGISSLKIEGRMKKAEYAAGVTAIYRKYIDLLEENGAADFRVDPADEEALYRLFNRNGFTDGYYERKNGAEMIQLSEKDFRAEDETLLQKIREKHLLKAPKTPVSASFVCLAGKPLTYRLRTVLCGVSYAYEATSEAIPEYARGRSATREELVDRLQKLGETDFYVRSMEGSFEDDLFLPVSVVNDVRRKAADGLRKTILDAFLRRSEDAS